MQELPGQAFRFGEFIDFTQNTAQMQHILHRLRRILAEFLAIQHKRLFRHQSGRIQRREVIVDTPQGSKRLGFGSSVPPRLPAADLERQFQETPRLSVVSAHVQIPASTLKQCAEFSAYMMQYLLVILYYPRDVSKQPPAVSPCPGIGWIGRKSGCQQSHSLAVRRNAFDRIEVSAHNELNKSVHSDSLIVSVYEREIDECREHLVIAEWISCSWRRGPCSAAAC